MLARLAAVLAVGVLDAEGTEEIKVVTFDGSPATTFNFSEKEDPVMGSRSWGNWSLSGAEGGFGILDGTVTVVDRPATSIPGASPGFIKAVATGPFADSSSAAGGNLVLTVRTSNASYPGFHVAFAAGARFPFLACEGGGHIPMSGGCYKAKFTVPAGNSFSAVRIPFASFSDSWLPKTGEQRVTCAQDKKVCPGPAELAKIQRIELWAEGADGHVNLEVKSICAEVTSHLDIMV
jgi:hypothetical protein